jgi:hypothetical protein
MGQCACTTGRQRSSYDGYANLEKGVAWQLWQEHFAGIHTIGPCNTKPLLIHKYHK